MTIEKAKCSNCGFGQKGIFVYAFSGANFHLKYACLKCKKIISSRESLEFCPTCKSKLVLYKGFNKDGNYLCPNCNKRKLKFYVEAYT